MKQTFMRFTAACHQLPVHWTTVSLLAMLAAYADGFWLIVVQGVVGAIERLDSPFKRWLLDSTLLLPLVILAVLGGLLVARRWFGPGRRVLVGLGASALLVSLLSTGVGSAAIAANSIYDYLLQQQHLLLLHSSGMSPQSGDGVAGAAAQPLQHDHHLSNMTIENTGGMADVNTLAQMAYKTRLAHMRALAYASGLLFATNLVLVTGVLTLWDDRLWKLDTTQQTGAPHPQTA